jgi:hypothetical protein
MSSIDELVAEIPISQLASQLGVDEKEAEQAVRQALPALVGGMAANAQDPSGAASLAEALGQHSVDLLDGGIDLGQVDTTDGEKIVHHVFGDNEEAVVNQLGGLGGGSGMIMKLLPLLAPLLMGFLAKNVLGKGGGGGGATAAPADTAGMGPSGTGGDAASDAGGGLGDVLGGLLGGEGGGGLGGLGDVLGGLLGGGRK